MRYPNHFVVSYKRIIKAIHTIFNREPSATNINDIIGCRGNPIIFMNVKEIEDGQKDR